MHYALQTITVEIYSNLHPARLLASSHAKDYEHILIEAGNILLCFIEQAFSLHSKEQLTNCIQHVQRGCIDLCNILGQYGSRLPERSFTPKQEKAVLLLYKNIQDQLVQLYCYLEKTFPEYFDTALPLPMCYWQQQALALRPGLQAVYKLGHPQLLQSACNEIQNALDHADALSISYRQLVYWQKVLARLQEIGSVTENERESWLIQWLLLLNCNSVTLPAAIMNIYTCEAARLDSLEEQLEYWYTVLRSVDHLLPMPGMHLHPGAMDSITVLSGFVQQEIGLLEKKILPSRAERANVNPPLKTYLSVPQLGLFYRLQVDAKMLDSSNKTALIKTVSDGYRTARSNTISKEKLYNKFYSADPASVSIMKTYLVNMLNLLKTY